MASKKGVIIAVVLVVGFVMLLGAAGVGFFAWKYYQSYMAARTAEGPIGIEMPSDAIPDTPSEPAPIEPASTPESEPYATPELSPTDEPTSEPAAEPAEASTPEPVKTAAPPKKTKAPKTAAPAQKAVATEEPEVETPAPKRAPSVPTFDLAHVHGGFSKKVCSGTVQFTETGFKYEATSSEDNKLDRAEYAFNQIKKVELKDPSTLEVATTDKKWTFRGEGLTLSKLSAHLKAHQNEWAGK
jgi:hypothetical protein